MYLFTRYKFNWSEIEFSFFSIYAMLVSGLRSLISKSKFYLNHIVGWHTERCILHRRFHSFTENSRRTDWLHELHIKDSELLCLLFRSKFPSVPYR